MPLRTRRLAQLRITDEAAFRAVPHYAVLKQALADADYRFRVLSGRDRGYWDRALFLNLTYWGGEGDVLMDETIHADVVAHAAWHVLAARALVPAGKPASADALFMGESIASAYDVYLLGVLLQRNKKSSFVETQASAMRDTAATAGFPKLAITNLFLFIAAEPEGAFVALRALLFAAATELVQATTPEGALKLLGRFDRHPFAPILHHYALSMWILYARAYAPRALQPVARIRALDRQLADRTLTLDDLLTRWTTP